MTGPVLSPRADRTSSEVALSSAFNFISASPSPWSAIILGLLSVLSVTVGLLLRYSGRAFLAWVNGKNRVAEIEAAGTADVARIEATGKVLRDLAELEPEQAERLQRHLERVRPPPDELQPPAAS
jgi:hypothetical protein